MARAGRHRRRCRSRHAGGRFGRPGKDDASPAPARPRPSSSTQQWASNYSPAKINYVGVGSGAGINAIVAGTVNFGASDKPLLVSSGPTPTLNSAKLVQFPSCIEGIVPIVNIPGVKSGKSQAHRHSSSPQIYLGKITKWNNSRIKALNPGLSLPSTRDHRHRTAPIRRARRSSSPSTCTPSTSRGARKA